MDKKSISSLDLRAIVKEMQVLARGKIGTIYHQANNEVIIQVHSRAKYLLKLIPGKWCCFTNLKNPPLRPTGFCMLLRKYIEHATLVSVTQKDAERIMILTMEKPDRFYLIIELFSKGNVILVDAEYKILAALDKHVWADRKVIEKETYVFPQGGINYTTVSRDQLSDILVKSEKKNIATCLATELALGGMYAEEICVRAGVDAKSDLKKLNEKDYTRLFSSLKEVVKTIDTADIKGFMYANQVTPIPLLGQEVLETKETFNGALEGLNPYRKASPYEKKIASMQNMISAQEASVLELDLSIVENTRKGELIYEQYVKLQKLKDIVGELAKTKKWNDIGLELKKEKKIKSVNLKEKKIQIEL